MPVYTLVYESTATLTEHATLQEKIDAILATSRRWNPQVGIGGALLVTEGRFVRALEGEKRHVEVMLDRIFADPRHRDATIPCAHATKKRSFSAWSMAFVGDTRALRRRYAGEPLASLVETRSGDRLVDFMREIALSTDDE
jgi:hypothetical protein